MPLLKKYYYVKPSTVKILMDALRDLLTSKIPNWEKAREALEAAEIETGDLIKPLLSKDMDRGAPTW